MSISCVDLHGPPWLTPRDAAQVARALEPYDLLFLEDPIPPENLDGYARIRDSANVPLAAGERMTTIYGLRELIERELVDVVQPDTGPRRRDHTDAQDRRDGGGASHHDGAAFRLARPGRRIRRTASDGVDPERPHPRASRRRLGRPRARP